MRAVVIEEFGGPMAVREVPEPVCEPGGVILTVAATGLCRSDWHAWQGHDSDVVLPHVPGHEIAGVVAAVGPQVTGWSVGNRVTVPFVCACGRCAECASGNGQTCLAQQQPGFTYWGSFAERVAVPDADLNLVALPDALGFDEAASLGCRLATAFRAVRHVGRVQAGESVAVFGCGGVGLSAVMLAAAVGADVIGIDRSPAALDLAAKFGARHCLLADPVGAALVEQIRTLTGGRGVDVTMDAVGSPSLTQLALSALRPRGRHLQVGLLPGASSLSLGPLIGQELQWLGSHGMAAAGYRELLAEIASGLIRPAELVTTRIGLSDVPAALAGLETSTAGGITVIHPVLG